MHSLGGGGGGGEIVNIGSVVTDLTLSPVWGEFTGSRNGVVVDIYWNIWSLLVIKV